MTDLSPTPTSGRSPEGGPGRGAEHGPGRHEGPGSARAALPRAARAALLGLTLAALSGPVAGCGSASPATPPGAGPSPGPAAEGTEPGGEAAPSARPTPGDAARSRGGTAGGPAAGDSVPANADFVDRIVAVVGDTALLFSEVRQELLRLSAQGVEIPEEPPARDSIFRAVVDRMVDDLILLEAARGAGISVPAGQVDRLVEQRFQEIRNRFPDTEAFRSAVERSGQNMYQFRQRMRAEVESQLLIQEYIRTRRSELPPASVTEEEIRRFYEVSFAGRQGPATVTLRRLLVEPEPDSAALARARTRADSALAELDRGDEFPVVARRWSDDSASRDQGGDIGWLRRSDVVPSFGDAAWSAPPGRPVGPVRTRYGYHILEVENVRGGERKIRHILFRPEITSDDVAEARKLANAVADTLRSGAATFDRMVDRYGDAPANRESPVEIPVQEIRSRLGPAYARALENPRAGQLLGPLPVAGTAGDSAFVLVRVTAYRPSGEVTLEEVRDRIRENLVQRKQYERLLARLREETYVRVLI